MSRPGEVIVQLDPKLWWDIALMAEKRGMSVPQLLAKFAHTAVEPKMSLPERDTYGRVDTPTERRKMTQRRLARLRELHEIGFTDGEIASRIGLSDESVRKWRNREGLGVVRRGRRTDAENERINQIGRKIA